ncbi:hypothetical protein D3C84_573290 [compost metagenome]
MTEQIKLTKAQRVFFAQFASQAIQNLIIAQARPEVAEAVAEAASGIVAEKDLSVVTEAIGQAFLSQVDFKTLVSVDKFIKSQAYQDVMTASNHVLSALAEEIGTELREVAEAVSEALAASEGPVTIEG